MSTDRAQTGHLRRIQLAIAASLVLVVGGAVLLSPRIHLGTLVVYRSAAEVPSTLLSGPRVSVTLIRLRGSSGARRVTAPRDAGALLVRVEPDSPPGPLGYAVGLTLEPGILSRTVSLNGLHTDADGYIEMYLPIAAVAGQTVKVTVNASPPASAREPLSFRLQIAYPETAPALN